MTQTKILDRVKLESIFHPSDFSEASEVAFVHALKMALVAGAKLTMLHAEASPGAEWQDFPGVRDTLERWGLIPKDSPKSAVGQPVIKVAEVLRLSNDPVKACIGFLEENPSDLIVLAVRQHEGRMRWLGKSVGRTDRARGRTNDALHPRRRGGLRLATGRLDLSPEYPHPGCDETPPAAERGSRCPFDPQPPVASWHGHVSPRGTHCRNAVAKATQGHRLDLDQGGQGR
jgi:nucleotide-binding universal stress UspA family protein